MTPLFDGEIVSLEPEFTARRRLVYTIRAYDRSHRLNREKHTRTFQDADVLGHRREGDRRGRARAPGRWTRRAAPTRSSSSQARPTGRSSGASPRDRLRGLRRGREGALPARRRRADAGRAGAGADAARFRARVTGVQQVNEVTVRGWDPKTKQEIVGTANGEQPASTERRIGRQRGRRRLPGGSVLIGNAPVALGERRDGGREVRARQDARLLAGRRRRGERRPHAPRRREGHDQGRRHSASRRLRAHADDAHGRGGDRYTTSFRVSGRTQRTLLDLVTPTQNAPWANGLVIGIVTNNKDPDKLGRVRVKFPTLADDLEGWWARVLSLNAGKQRGLLMMPQVGDEVVVGFEHGDPPRPFVVGSLWNGKEPADLQTWTRPRATFELRSDEKVHIRAQEMKSIFNETRRRSPGPRRHRRHLLDATGRRGDEVQADHQGGGERRRSRSTPRLGDHQGHAARSPSRPAAR